MASDVYTHWRDSALSPRFFIVDARVTLFLVIALFHPRWWSLILALVLIALFTVLEYFKLTLAVALRVIRGWASGKKKLR